MENWVKKIESYKDYPEGTAEKREYDALQLPESDFARKYYSNALEGSSERKLYDYYTLPLETYIALYFVNPDLTRWNNWYQKFVAPAFVILERAEYLEHLKKLQTPFLPDIERLDATYPGIKLDTRIDPELQQFFAFVESTGVFDKMKTTFSDWMNDKNWQGQTSSSGQQVAVNAIISFKYGTNYLKTILIDVLIKTR